MKKSLVFLSLVLLLVACGRSRPPQPIPTPDASPRVLGQVDVTFQVDPASGELSTSASHLAAQATTNAFSFAPLSKGLTDKDGVRYLYGTFKVGNTSNTKMNNLSFYALSTSQSIAGTAISELRDANNQPVNEASYARSILPTHRMSDNSGRLVVKADEADFQGFSAAQVQGVQSELSFGTLLEYGYSVHNSAGAQALVAGEEGVVSFAIKFPYNPSQSASFPFSFTLSFAAVANGPSQVTRSAEENANSAADVCSRAVRVGTTKVVVIGSSLPGDVPVGCSPVRLNDVKIATAANGFDEKYLLGNGAGAAEPDLQLSSRRLVYTTQGNASAVQTLLLRNIGSGPLNVTGLSLAGDDAGQFSLANTSLPFTLQANETRDLQVTFSPSTLGPKGALLNVSSNDPDSASVGVSLRGLNAKGLGGANEPSLQWILDALELPVTVGDPNPNDNAMPTSALLGDEIAAQRFEKAGAGKVTVDTLAVFGPDANNPVTAFGWYVIDGPLNELFTVSNNPKDSAQRLLPPTDGAFSFDPGAQTFGFASRWPFFNNRVVYSEDARNTFGGAIPHHVRVYPLKDASGVVPNAYIVATEETTSGFDYQDIVVVVRNVKPVASPEPVGCAPRSALTCDEIAVSLPYSLTWSGDEGGLEDKSGVGTGFTMVDPPSARLSADNPVFNSKVPGYEPGKLSVGGGALTVTSTKGIQYRDPSKSSDTNSQINALGVGVSVNTNKIRVETTVVNPNFAASSGNSAQQAGVWFGLDEDNYAKLVVSKTGDSTGKIQLLVEDYGSAPGALPTELGSSDLANVTTQSVTLILELDPAARTATGYYRLNGGAEVRLEQSGQTSLALSQAFFTGVDYGGSAKGSFAGIFTTLRRAAASPAIPFAFSDFSVSEVKPPTLSNAEVTLQNLDGVPFADRLAFNRIQTPNASIPNGVHDRATVRVKNTGSDPLQISNITLSGPWSTSATPATVAAGGQLDIEVTFVAQNNGANNGFYEGALVITSDAKNGPKTTVSLGGFWQSVSEGGQEPDVSEIVKTFGYGTVIRRSGESINNKGRIETIGDEILSPYWNVADGSKNVTVRQLAAYHTQGNTAKFFWHLKGSDNTTKVLEHAGVDGQSFLPRLNGNLSKPAYGEFKPGGTFGFKIDPEWSDPAKNNKSKDDCSGGSNTCGHHLRVWPAKDRAGVVIPNTYLVVMDYSGINYDFNDNVYLVTNVTPAQ